MKVLRQAILPLGFKASGIAAGIKKSGKPDLALFYSQVPAIASCLFTANKVKAACIKINKVYLKKNSFYRAFIVNSGNANCCTGKKGLKDAELMILKTAQVIKTDKRSVLVASTGVIGRSMPILKIERAIPKLAAGLSCSGINQAKLAIMTTDTFAKEISVKFNLGNRVVTICGIAKGAGMIAPNMATMLAFIFTDANISQAALDKALKISVSQSFNCITVDGCMSTNDSVMVLANAKAGNPPIVLGKNFEPFVKALNLVCLELAKMIVKDAEGATKFIRIRVEGAANLKEARRVALSIANSNLFKTAVYGKNPNFGRIMAAIGSSAVNIKEDNIKFKVSSLEKKEVSVFVALGMGKAKAEIYTCDLTPEYVKINAEYN